VEPTMALVGRCII